MAAQLTEDIIKKVTLRFFRNHYKFRLRFEDQPVVARYDLEGVGGIVADGVYAFKKPDGRPFTATFEATSQASAQEVRYKPLRELLVWDGISVASTVLCLVAAANLRWGFHELNQVTALARTGQVLLVSCAVLAVFFLVAGRLRRYRYIYAVEQFKKYHADEQWIALAHDVFPGDRDRYFRELRQQCVINGFGLVVIDGNLDPRIVVTPSRQDIFKGKRKQVDLVPKGTGNERLPARPMARWSALRARLPGASRDSGALLRYRRTYYHQMLVTALGICLTGLVFQREWRDPGIVRVDKEAFRSVREGIRQQGPETGAIPEDVGLMQAAGRLAATGDRFWWLEKDSVNVPVRKEPERGSPGLPLYDCTRFYSHSETMFALVAGNFQVADHAAEASARLGRLGLETMAVRGDCLGYGKDGISLVAQTIFTDSTEAAAERFRWLERLEDAGRSEAPAIRRIVRLR